MVGVEKIVRNLSKKNKKVSLKATSNRKRDASFHVVLLQGIDMERKRKSTLAKKNKERKKKKKGHPSFSLSRFVWIGSMAEPGDSIAVPSHASVSIHVMHASVQASKKFFVHYPHKK